MSLALLTETDAQCSLCAVHMQSRQQGHEHSVQIRRPGTRVAGGKTAAENKARKLVLAFLCEQKG